MKSLLCRCFQSFWFQCPVWRPFPYLKLECLKRCCSNSVFFCFFPYLQYFLNEIVLMNFFIIIFCTNAFQLLYDSPPNIVFFKIFLNSKPFKLSSNNYFIFLVPRYWWENWCYNHDAKVKRNLCSIFLYSWN